MYFNHNIKPTLTIGGFFIGLSCGFVSLFSDLVRFLLAILNKTFSETKLFVIAGNGSTIALFGNYNWHLPTQARCDKHVLLILNSKKQIATLVQRLSQKERACRSLAAGKEAH